MKSKSKWIALSLTAVLTLGLFSTKLEAAYNNGSSSSNNGSSSYNNGNPSTMTEDGASVQVNPDGSKVIRKPDGTVIEVRPDGSKKIKKPDGTTVEVRPGS